MMSDGSAPRRFAIALAISAIAMSACRGETETRPTTSPASQTPAASSENARPSRASAPPKPAPIVAPIDPEALKSVLPEISGWTRGTRRGATLASPAAFSKAEAQYEHVPAIVHVEVQDTALNQVLLSGMTMFLSAGYEERSADGHKKSGTYQGHPGFEEWKREARRGEINILVAKRFIVSAIGQRLENMNQLAQVVNALDLKKLASLK